MEEPGVSVTVIVLLSNNQYPFNLTIWQNHGNVLNSEFCAQNSNSLYTVCGRPDRTLLEITLESFFFFFLKKFKLKLKLKTQNNQTFHSEQLT